MPIALRLVAMAALTASTWAPTEGAELNRRTIAAFDRYARAAESQMDARTEFLSVDALDEATRHTRLARIRGGEPHIVRLEAKESGRGIDVPDGLIHHWLGLTFAPGASLDQALGLLQDYDRHSVVYRPAIARSELMSRTNDVFRVHLRFRMKRIITVVVDTDNEARFTRVGADRAQSRIYSLRVNEVEEPDTPRERTRPEGNDGGYLWRLYTYWRFLERDGGTYVQCESISLSRTIPVAFRWLIGPFVTSIPRDSLTFMLETTRTALAK